jgi:23S rRNA pseudouridine1911/1915/1917 synthase
MKLTVGPELEGERVDKAVASLAEVSRSVARTMVESGKVLVDGAPVAPRDRVGTGAVISFEPPEVPVLQPEEVAFDVRYEDGDIAIVDKPAGVLVHPGGGRSRGTLAAGLLHRWPSIEGVGQPDRWGLVHRLDRDTSGLLVVALSDDAYAELTRALKAREIARIYLALVRGSFDLPSGTIDAPIGRDPRQRARRSIQRGGRPARTHFRRLAGWRDADVSLLEVRLETGRTHQIRVHLASIGHAVVGDRLYGGAGGPVVERIWLHAASLSFRHPVTGALVQVTSPLPAELEDALESLGVPDVGDVPER